MPNQGYLVTPEFVENEATGEQHYDFDNASVVGTSTREQIRDDIQREASENVFVDDDGDLQTAPPEIADTDAHNLMEWVGGEEVYTEALKWAAANLDQDDIEIYDEVMAGNNLAEIKDLMGQLMDKYHDAQSDDFGYQEFQEYFFNEVCPRDAFPVIVDWMKNNCDEYFIDETNNFLDSKDYAGYTRNIISVINQINALDQ